MPHKRQATAFGIAADDYATFRAGFPDSFFDRLAAFGVGQEGQAVVDLGTGTGTLARGFARRGCEVVGVDPDERLTLKAQQLDQEAGLEVQYVTAWAEETSLPPGSADVVTAGQCWHWFDEPAASEEVVRLLKPGGRLVIAHFDWVALKGNMVRDTEILIEKYNPAWHMGQGLGVHPEWLPGLGLAGFGDLETFSYDIEVPYTHEAWRGRVRACAGITVLPPDAKAAFDAEHAAMLAETWPEETLRVPHRVFAIVAGRP